VAGVERDDHRRAAPAARPDGNVRWRRSLAGRRRLPGPVAQPTGGPVCPGHGQRRGAGRRGRLADTRAACAAWLWPRAAACRGWAGCRRSAQCC
jgi:hypothetical protein